MAIVTAPQGARIVDTGSVLTAGQCAALAQAGVWGVVLDVATPGIAASIAAARANGLHVGVFQGYYAPAFLNAAAADQRAQWALAVLHGAGLVEPGLTVWLDWEAVPAQETPQAAVAWINAWAHEVQQAGLVPGLYVGADQPLSGADLYADLVVTRYWRACSASVPPVAQRGYCLVQTACDQVIAGVTVDEDQAQRDALGGEATWVPPVVTVETQTWATVSQVQALSARVVALESALRQTGHLWGGL